MRYGVPYKGSKNSIAEWVYSHFPKADNFYDLFAGGCAITQIALMRQEYKNYFCNDIDGGGGRVFIAERNRRAREYNSRPERKKVNADRARLRRQRMKVEEPEKYAQQRARQLAYQKEWYKRKKATR